jgi:hypothetical protein
MITLLDTLQYLEPNDILIMSFSAMKQKAWSFYTDTEKVKSSYGHYIVIKYRNTECAEKVKRQLYKKGVFVLTHNKWLFYAH